MTNDIDIPFAPESVRTYDQHFSTRSEEPQLEHGDGRLCFGVQNHHDIVSPVECVELPVHLLTELRVAEFLDPAGVPVVPSRVEDIKSQRCEKFFHFGLPVGGGAHFDGTGE